MIVLLCGDRNWNSIGVIEEALSKLHATAGIDLLIQGAYRGADILGAAVARRLGITVQDFPAAWRRYGKRAGYMRNALMLERLLEIEPRPSALTERLVLAFHDNLRASDGTRMMVELAHAKGVECWVIDSRNDKYVYGRGGG